MSKCTLNQNVYQLIDLEESFPKNGDLYYAISKLYQNSSYWKAALEYLEKAEKHLSETEVELFLDFGKTYKNLREYKKSIEYYRKVEDKKIEADLEHLGRLSRCYLEVENFKEAEKYYNKALLQQPDSIRFLNDIAWCYIKLDNYDLAMKHLFKVEQIKPNDAWALGKIGYCYQQDKQDYQKALSYHGKSKNKGSPEAPWNESNIAWCNFMLGDYQKAKSIYEELFKQERKYYQLMNIGHIYLCENNLVKAIEFYEESLKKYESPEEFEKAFLEDFKHIQLHQNINEEKYKQILKDLLN